MRSLNPLVVWRSFLALPNRAPLKTFGVAFIVALLCSVVVSVTAVSLKPLQQENRMRERAASMVKMVEGLGYGLPQRRFVARTSGAYVSQDSPKQTQLLAAQDKAGLGQVEDVVTVFEVRVQNRLELVVLPVRGVGYKSMMKGYVALKSDLATIAGLTFHEQDETPGMGAKIMDADWQAKWAGKHVRDENGVMRIEVVKGQAQTAYQVDGISGATRTGWGVTNLVQFWLGPDGFGPYLAAKKREAG